jgi:hypothetical protein
VDREGVAVRVGEGERAPERAVEGGRHNRYASRGQPVVQGLRVAGVQPQRHAETRAVGCVEVYAGQRVTHGERDRRGAEHDRVGRADRGAAQAEPVLVEGGGAVQVTDLKRDEVGSGDGHDALLVYVKVLTSSYMSGY